MRVKPASRAQCALRPALAVIFGATASSALACSVSATDLAFGTINPLISGATDSASSITVTCPSSTSYSITLSAGNGTYAERELHSGTHVLSYNIYTDAARTIVWGDGTGGVAVEGTADSDGTIHTAYGRVPHDPAAVPASYADSIVVTISF